MNCKTESENEELLGQSEVKTEASNSKSNNSVEKDDASVTSAANINCEESQSNEFNNEGLLRVAAKEQLPNDASSSEFSIRSETLTGPNGDVHVTSDSDCHTYAVRDKWEKTTRPKSRKRKVKPLIPGFAKDWESNDSWTSEKAHEEGSVVAEEIETKRRKIKSLQQRNRRLKVRHSRLKAAIKELKANMADRD